MGLKKFKDDRPAELWCHYCGWLIPLGEETIDHKLAKAKGGLNHDANLVWSCLLCNVTKSDMDYHEFKWRRSITTVLLQDLEAKARHKKQGERELSKFISKWHKFHKKILWTKTPTLSSVPSASDTTPLFAVE
jgi:hypothetical protein